MKFSKLVAIIVAVILMTGQIAWATSADGKAELGKTATEGDKTATKVPEAPVNDDFPGLLGRDVPDEVADKVRGEWLYYALTLATWCTQYCMQAYELGSAYVDTYKLLFK